MKTLAPNYTCYMLHLSERNVLAIKVSDQGKPQLLGNPAIITKHISPKIINTSPKNGQ